MNIGPKKASPYVDRQRKRKTDKVGESKRFEKQATFANFASILREGVLRHYSQQELKRTKTNIWTHLGGNHSMIIVKL